jgi:multiple sugar transport system permease protein
VKRLKKQTEVSFKKLSNHLVHPSDGGRRLMIFLVIGGFLLYLTIFMLFPIAYALVGSFFDWNPIGDEFNFTGVSNYANILSDALFWKSLVNTLYLAGAIVIIRTIVSLFIAIGINALPKATTFFRTAYFLPVITSVIAISIVWKAMYDPTYGMINEILVSMGLNAKSWLLDAHLVIPSIIIMTVWKELGYTVILFLAGLQTIPKMYYEAARIDGANNYQVFWNITLPLLQPMTIFIVVTSVIGFMQIFGQIYIMTTGGPGTASYTLVYMIYDEAFIKYNFGVASSISFVLFIIIMIFTFLQLKVMKQDWSY